MVVLVRINMAVTTAFADLHLLADTVRTVSDIDKTV